MNYDVVFLRDLVQLLRNYSSVFIFFIDEKLCEDDDTL